MPLHHYHEDEPMALSSVLLVELSRHWCRRKVLLAPTDQDLPVGTVVTDDREGPAAPYLKAAEDDKAAAVLIAPARKSEQPQEVVAVVRGVVVSAANLFFLKSVTEAQKKKALEQLDSLGIVPEEIN